MMGKRGRNKRGRDETREKRGGEEREKSVR